MKSITQEELDKRIELHSLWLNRNNTMNINNVFLPYGEQALNPSKGCANPNSIKKVKGSYKQRLWAKVHGAVKANAVKWWV